MMQKQISTDKPAKNLLGAGIRTGQKTGWESYALEKHSFDI